MAKRKKAARWRAVFLRALARTGNVRASAEAAGVDPGTAYDHRIKDARFKAQWEGAKAKARTRPSPHRTAPHAVRARPASGRGGELVPRRSKRHGVQMVRASPGRWCREVEETFFAALGRTGCTVQAAAAAGISTTALYERRDHYPDFAAKWREVEGQARERIPGLLTAATIARFDPEAAEAQGKRLPEVNVDQAIRISQMKGRDAGPGGEKPDWWEDSVVACRHCGRRGPRVASNAEVREALTKALKAYDGRAEAERIAEGWIVSEDGHMIPPGWIKGPDWRPTPLRGGAGEEGGEGAEA